MNINTGSNILTSSIQQVPEQLPEKIETKEEDLEHIKLYSDVLDSDESQPANQEMIQVNINNGLEQNHQSQQIYTNEQIIAQQNQYSQQYAESQPDLEKVFLQQQSTQVTTEQNGGEFDIDAYLKQQGYDKNVQVQNNKTE